MPASISPTPRLLATVMLCATLFLGACGRENPFGGDVEDQAKPVGTTAAVPSTPPAVATSPVVTSVETPTTPDASTPAVSTPPVSTTPAEAPSPGGTTATGADQVPTTFAGRVKADQTAMLNVRTMVSIIEGCHSGRESYQQCDTHAELGSAKTLGLTIGKQPGQVQITAGNTGFRVTARSLSGGNYTFARGPLGDRFKCNSGTQPGACPPTRVWSW